MPKLTPKQEEMVKRAKGEVFPIFWALLAEAHEASEDVDHFNPDSSKEDQEEFSRLCEQSSQDALTLVNHIIQHKDEIIEALTKHE